MILGKRWYEYMKLGSVLTKNYNKIIMSLMALVLIMTFLKVLKVDELIADLDMNNLNQLEYENEQYKNLGSNPIVRVLITSEHFKEEEHKELAFEGECLYIENKDGMEKISDIDKITLKPDDILFEEGSIIIKNTDGAGITIESFERNYGNPTYSGVMEVYSTGDKLVLINELPLEEYLRWVVPSEMPSSYELEALKAQAICARSYAYSQMQTISYPDYDAHMNDSVSYQVYNNTQAKDSSDEAIKQTVNEKLGVNGKVITTYFFSTSSGYTTDVRAWGTKQSEANSYLESIHIGSGDEDYESHLPWYSWNIEIGESDMDKILQLNIDDEIGKLENVAIDEVGAGDVALSLVISGSEKETTIHGENAIRKALGSDLYDITRNDGKTSQGSSLLPSAFFTIDKKDDIYYIEGGGLGHGIGMSQNGANEMAKLGSDYLEILTTFYQGVEIIKD